jgi:recombination protein RecA
MEKAKPNQIEDVLKNIAKKYGNDVVTTGEVKDIANIESISTNCYSLDAVFGCGGLPVGRIIDIYGEASSGKSTMAMYMVAQVQKKGGTCVWIDTEYSFTYEYAKNIGIDVNKLILVQPNTGEEALNIITDFVEAGGISLIVLDSTGSLVAEKEIEGNIEDANMALQARMISKCLRVITPNSAKNKTTVLFISQTRSKISTGWTPAGAPTTDTTGGKALKFYASVRLKVDRIQKIETKEKEIVGNRLKIEATKNKVGIPFRKTEIGLYFAKGIDVEGDIFDVAFSKGLLSKSGNTYSYKDKVLGIGRENALQTLSEDKELYKKVKSEVMGEKVPEKTDKK